MRPLLHSLAVVALTAGCQDYSLYDEDAYVGQNEAPDLATPRKTDLVVQTMPDRVDILWVIDDSGSMSQEQEKIATQFEAFAQFFVGSGLDWHMGVITSDTDDGLKNGILRTVAGMAYITDDTPHPEELFAHLARVGTWGSGDERALNAMWNTVTEASTDIAQRNAGFLRDDAALHIVVIGDEDDMSDRSTSEYASMLNTLKPDADIPVTFNAIVGQLPNGCRGDGGDAAPAYRIIEVARAVGGQIYSICEADWYPVLEALGLQAAGLRDEYYLSELPVPGSITVLVEDRSGITHGLDEASLVGTDLTTACADAGHDACFAFAYDATRNAIRTLDWRPGPRSRIGITYGLLKATQGTDQVTDVLE